MLKYRIMATIVGFVMFKINIAIISAIGALILVCLLTNLLIRLTED